jgi:glycosyltransferase involved in cell wall biosynthesis
MQRTITLVIPWYGPDTAGGAETQARSLARALHRVGVQVRVWASTGRDSFHPGEDTYYPHGPGEVDGVPIWRFAPTPADEHGVPCFFRSHPHLLPPLEQFTIHELRLLGSLLGSDELYEAIIHEREQDTTCFVFMPYAFPTTFWGALLAPDKSYVLPCLHDEPYARYNTYRHLLSQVRGILCNSHPEAALVRRLCALPPERVHVPGEGIDLAPRGDGTAFRERFRQQIGGPSGGIVNGPGGEITPDPLLLLYVGRRDESKNFWLLLAYVREYWARRGLPIRLLLAGRNPLDLPRGLAPLVCDLGYIIEQEKHDTYAAADVFLQPSLYESFSIVLMEAWLQNTPALVHGRCAVTADHCQHSGGGLTFTDFGSFAAALDLLLGSAEVRQTLGARGRAYVLDTCNWDDVARRTARAVGVLP